MLEGLEAVIINFSVCTSIIDFRIDANTFKKDYIKSDKLINSIRYSTIEDISTSVQNFGAYSLCNFINFSSFGIPFLMTQNVRHNYIDWNIEKFVNKESHIMLSKSHCRKGQVLVTMAGEYLGRVAVYDRDEICSSNQAIAKVTLKNKENPYIISTFLNSKHGQNQINRFKTITGQPNINMSLIKSLKIPEFSTSFQMQIEALILASERKRNFTINIYQESETLLLETLGLNKFEPTAEAVNVKSFKESFLSSGRLDAEYYQNKYDDYIDLICRYPNGYELIEVVCKQKDINYTPKDNVEYKYIELANIGKTGDIKGCTIAFGSELPTRARRKVNTNDVIISSIEGSLDSCAIVTEEYDNALCSTGFYIISSNKINSETLLVLFKSEPIQNILKKGCSGTILTAINKIEFQNIPVPIIDKQIQQQIASLVSESFTLKKQSEQLLETAKRAVEIAIEDGEENAFQFIDNADNTLNNKQLN